MTTHRAAKTAKLIERSSLGTPHARAVRQTVTPTLAANLVARSSAKSLKQARPKKLDRS